MDCHALDAVFAWLDGESLLRAVMVCRRWAERAFRPEAWRGRTTPVEWLREMPARDAYRRSLEARTRWRRGRVAVTQLAARNANLLCVDRHWIAYRPEDAGPMRVYDVAGARTVGLLPCPANSVALSVRKARCATIRWEPNACGTVGTGRPVCTVWAPPSEGLRWRVAYEVPFDGADICLPRVRWHDDGLLVCTNTDSTGGSVVEWFDAGAGAAVSVARHGFRNTGMAGPLLFGSGTRVFLTDMRVVHALDPRVPPDHRRPLLTLCDGDAGYSRHDPVALDDGRHIAVLRSTARRFEPAGAELWDVRGASGRASLAAQLPDAREWNALCATARGTVLGWVRRPCDDRRNCVSPRYPCPGCRVVLEEWDTARGSVEPLLAVGTGHAMLLDDMFHVWGDERRTVLYYDFRRADGLYVLDTDPNPAAAPTATPPGAHGVPTATLPGADGAPTAICFGAHGVSTATRPGTHDVPTATLPGADGAPTAILPGAHDVPTAILPGADGAPTATLPGADGAPTAILPGADGAPTAILPGADGAP